MFCDSFNVPICGKKRPMLDIPSDRRLRHSAKIETFSARTLRDIPFRQPNGAIRHSQHFYEKVSPPNQWNGQQESLEPSFPDGQPSRVLCWFSRNLPFSWTAGIGMCGCFFLLRIRFRIGRLILHLSFHSCHVAFMLLFRLVPLRKVGQVSDFSQQCHFQEPLLS